MGGNPFPSPTPDFMTKFGGEKSKVFMNAGTINKYVSISSPFVNYVPPSDAPPNTDNYKCMPLDMAQIQTSDLSGAKTLTQVLLPEAKGDKLLDPGLTEKVLTIILGVTMGIIILSVGFFTIFNIVVPSVAPTAGESGLTNNIMKMLADMKYYILAGVIGVIAGALISYFVNRKDAPKK